MPGRCTLTTTDFPGGQAGDVGLADRGRRQRRPVELGEDLVDVGTELGLQHSGDVIGGHRLDPVLQRGQVGAHVGRAGDRRAVAAIWPSLM